jgi:hypothetical protein
MKGVERKENQGGFVETIVIWGVALAAVVIPLVSQSAREWQEQR